MSEKKAKKISNNNTNKKIKILISLVALVLIFSAVIYNSYSYYITSSASNLAIGGTAFVSSADINLKIYLEDRNASGNGVGTYSREYFIPTANYKYNSSKTACTKGIIIKDFSNGQFNIEAENKGWCKVYFDAVDGYLAETNFNLYVEQTQGQSDYKQVGRIPDDLNTYVIDTSKTKCTGEGAASASLSITNREIYLTTNGDVTCEIYAKISSTASSYATLSSTVIELASQGELASDELCSNIFASTNKYKVITENGYRYNGCADNYISFNGELWRIIGVFDGADIGMKSGSYYPKLIRSYSTVATADTTSSSDYVNSSLHKYLDGEYYNSFNSVAKSQIISATWHLGALSSSCGLFNGSCGAYYYNFERGNSLGFGAVSSKMQAKIAIAYLSDLLYSYTTQTYLFSFSYGYMPMGITLGVYSDGNYTTNGTNKDENPSDPTNKYFYPVVYLDADIIIIGGTGTKTNPYRIK